MRECAIDSPGGNDGEFQLEIHKRLDDHFLLPGVAKGGFDLDGSATFACPLPS